MLGLAEIRYCIAVLAGKGGVGKSTVAVHLAGALASKNVVGLLDADIYGPSLQQMLKEESLPCNADGESLHPAKAGEISLMSYAYFQQAGGAVRAPVANGLIEQFVHGVRWGKLDYLVVDFPPGTGDIPLTLLQEIPFDGAVLVTTPQEVALIDVEKTILMLQRMCVPILGLIENMSFLQLPEGGHFSFWTRRRYGALSKI